MCASVQNRKTVEQTQYETAQIGKKLQLSNIQLKKIELSTLIP